MAAVLASIRQQNQEQSAHYSYQPPDGQGLAGKILEGDLGNAGEQPHQCINDLNGNIQVGDSTDSPPVAQRFSFLASPCAHWVYAIAYHYPTDNTITVTPAFRSVRPRFSMKRVGAEFVSGVTNK
jgi:hypothetical protein